MLTIRKERKKMENKKCWRKYKIKVKGKKTKKKTKLATHMRK